MSLHYAYVVFMHKGLPRIFHWEEARSKGRKSRPKAERGGGIIGEGQQTTRTPLVVHSILTLSVPQRWYQVPTSLNLLKSE